MLDEERPDESAATIPVVVTLDEAADGDEMGLFGRGEGETTVRMIPVDELRANLGRTVAALRHAFTEVGEHLGPLSLSEIQLGFEVSASGHVALIGTAGAKAAITLVFSDPGKDAK